MTDSFVLAHLPKLRRAPAALRVIAVALAWVVAPMQSGAAPTSPFVAALAGVYDGPGNAIGPEKFVTSTTAPVLAEVGAGPDAYGRFRSAFGSNGFEATTLSGIDREVDGGSLWSDGFVVSGGTGPGTLSLSAHIVGSVTGHGEMFYGLYTSASEFDLETMLASIRAASGFLSVRFPNATRQMSTGVANGCGLPRPMGDCSLAPYVNYQGLLDLTLTADVEFTYGQPMYVASGFGGGMGIYGGTENFFNSATFGITAPAGATLRSISGATYAQAAAVPEPAIWMLLATGLGAGATMRSRARRR